MFKKSSRSKNIRRKIEVTDEEEPKVVQEEQEEIVIRKTINKKKRPKLTSISYEEEGDTEEFKVKKSKASKRLNSEHKLRLLDTLDTLEQDAKVSLYDADSLERLRANTAALPASLKVQDDDALLREKFPTQMNATIEGGTSIPDSSAILAAKKKREQLRKNLNIIEEGEDFISLNENEEESGAGSRLIREEDDIADDGEAEFEKYVGEGFTLNKKSAKQQAQQHRESVREMIDDAQDDNEGEEDMERWEEDMMKFGGAKTKESKYDPYARPPNYRPAQVPAPSSIPTLSDMMNRLNVRSKEIKYTKEQEEGQITEKRTTIQTCKTTLNDIDNEMIRAKDRYEYFQQLLQYIDDLGEFADTKYPELEKLEQDAHNLISKRSQIAIARRRQDALDDLALFMDIPAFIMNGADTPMDEFGRTEELRNSEPARHRRRAERKQRQSRQATIADLTGDDERIREEGLWTDDELEEESDARDAGLEEIQTVGVEGMMEEVGDAFKTLSSVKDRFEAWKTAYFDDYQKAYGSLSLPTAFDFYIRMELVTYDPFSSPYDFDQMEWHRILSQYGVTDQDQDPDIEMLNKIVSKTMVTKIKSLLDCLDGASSRDMKYGAYTMEQVSYYVDTNDTVYKDLALDIVNVIETQIMHFAEIVESSTLNISNAPTPEALEAKQRFIWSQCKYIKTLTHWRRHLPKAYLDSLGDNIMNRIIMPLLRVDLYPREREMQEEVLSLLSRLKK
ncbi:GCFC-domain-containing protein [Backusella circina FSU 941]|nr:GCFC-domain-containing protein [Backusella circina FSU 941]